MRFVANKKINGISVCLQEIETGRTKPFASLAGCIEWCQNHLDVKIGYYGFHQNRVYFSDKTQQTYKVVHANRSNTGGKIESIDSEEIWKLFYVGTGKRKIQYYISNYGRCKALNPKSNVEKIRRCCMQSKYYHITIADCGQTKNFSAHRLVCEAFVSKIEGNDHVDHIDGDPTNNKASNLRWVKNVDENMKNEVTRDRFMKRRVQAPVAQLDPKTNVVIHTYDCARDAALKNGFSSSFLLYVCRHPSRKAYGYFWKFI